MEKVIETSPDRQLIEERYQSGVPQILSTPLVADLETPISAYLKLTGSAWGSFLLESVEGGATRGRYTIIGFAPDIVWRCYGNKAEIATVGDDGRHRQFQVH